MKGFVFAMLFPVILFLAGCGGSGGGGSGGTDGGIPPGYIRVTVITWVHDANDIPQVNTQVSEVVKKNTDDIIAGYLHCFNQTASKISRTFYGHELIVEQSNTSAGYNPSVSLGPSGLGNQQAFIDRTRELLNSSGFVPDGATYTYISFSTS